MVFMPRFHAAEWRELSADQKKHAVAISLEGKAIFRTVFNDVVRGVADAVSPMNVFCLLDNGVPVSVLRVTAERGKGSIFFHDMVSENNGSNRAFYRFTRENFGAGRTPMQELFLRALHWAKPLGCSRIRGFFLKKGKKFLERQVSDGLLGPCNAVNFEALQTPFELSANPEKLAEHPRTRFGGVAGRLLTHFRRH